VLGEAVKALLQAIALVFLVMWLFMGNMRATLIPTIAVPVVLLGTCGGAVTVWLRRTRCGIRDAGCGIRDAGYGMRDAILSGRHFLSALANWLFAIHDLLPTSLNPQYKSNLQANARYVICPTVITGPDFVACGF